MSDHLVMPSKKETFAMVAKEFIFEEVAVLRKRFS